MRAGRLVGDLFDGEGFVRGLRRKDCIVAGAGALVVGAGGVGSAIAASLAAAGVASIALFDARADVAEALAARLRAHYPALQVRTGSNDPAGFDIVVNATPLGMNDDDAMPMDVTRIATYELPKGFAQAAGLVRAAADGSGEIRISVGGKQVLVPAKAVNAAADRSTGTRPWIKQNRRNARSATTKNCVEPTAPVPAWPSTARVTSAAVNPTSSTPGSRLSRKRRARST
jgi:threonine dehydrogenase-like Zn-dependent dehydrogenase